MPELGGLHLQILLKPLKTPLHPYFSILKSMYSEQLGSNLQPLRNLGVNFL